MKIFATRLLCVVFVCVPFFDYVLISLFRVVCEDQPLSGQEAGVQEEDAREEVFPEPRL